MSVIIRLQNLPWAANALDIRQYFGGLSIPEGGVHIVGGELGDAFIAFSTDEDARQAFLRNNGKIKEIQISLMLSSRTEMQKVIEQARAKSFAAFMQPPAVIVPTPAAVPAQVPLPTAVPQIIPAAVPELKKEKEVVNDKISKREGRRRSRSKSKEKDRKDRSRDRDRKDRRYRDRSRSKSRERKGSRRRDRSRSRNRSRSRERDRRTSSRDLRKRSEEKTVPTFQKDQRKPDPWANPAKVDVLPGLMQAQTGVVAPAFLEANKRGGAQLNGFPVQGGPGNFPINDMPRNTRDSWPPSNQNQGGFQSRNSDSFAQSDQFPNNDRFRKRHFNRFEPIENISIALEPFFGGYSDIRKFFHGMFITNRGIKFINDSTGRRTGIVYVQFANLRAKQDALDMSGRMLNGLEITITHLDDKEFEEAVDRYVPTSYDDSNSNDKFKTRLGPKVFHKNDESEPELTDFTCLIIEDLPNYVKDQDILHIFEMYPLVALNIVNRRRGGPIAYVKFGSKDEAKKALGETSSHIVGGKPVTVKPCSDSIFDENNKQVDIILTSPKIEDIGTDCLSVSRLPQKTSDKDIADFFSDIGVIPTKIHLMSNNMGFTGEAYCEFLNSEEASRAAKKNDTMLGSSAISVIPITRLEMNKILGSAFPAPMDQAGGPPPMNNQQHSPPLHHFSGGNQSQEMFGGHNRPQFFNNRNSFDYDGQHRGARFQGPRGGPGPRMRFHSNHMDGDEIPPGCTIYMKNVPYKASTNDILDFFEGYSHTGNVSRRYNPNNTPTDEAKITFYDPDEASRAVEDLRKMKIWDRSIFLRQE